MITNLALRVACSARPGTVMRPSAGLNLLAAGRGVSLAYALAGEETHLAGSDRSIHGLIPVEGEQAVVPEGARIAGKTAQSVGLAWRRRLLR